MEVMGSNEAAARRNARTAVTGAQNGGRQGTFDRAVNMGIDLQKEWVSTHDGKVRDSHAELDGVRVGNDRPFPNGCMFPGDPAGHPREVYNCRCAMRAILPKYNGNKRMTALNGGANTQASYAKWVIEKEKGKPYSKEAPIITGKPGSVEEAKSYTHNGKTYYVDGINVQHKADEREKEVARMYASIYGRQVSLVPKIYGSIKNVHTPDYIIDGVRVDLKEIKVDGKDTIYNAVKKSLDYDQAEDFIIDISSGVIDLIKAIDRVEMLFLKPYCKKLKSVDIIRDNKILWSYKRK